jgi:hypothetical protein
MAYPLISYMNYISLLFTIFSSLIAFMIYYRAKKLHDLVDHQGIRSFRDAFFWWGASFAVRTVHVILANRYALVTTFLAMAFFYCLALGAFYLVHSLVWKRLIGDDTLLFHLFSIGLVAGTLYYYPGMIFLACMILLGYAIAISYSNYKRAKGFHQFYFISLVIAFLAYLVNFLTIYFSSPYFLILSYLATMAALLIFLAGVLRFTR